MSLKALAKLSFEIMPHGLHDAMLWQFEDFYFLCWKLKQTRQENPHGRFGDLAGESLVGPSQEASVHIYRAAAGVGEQEGNQGACDLHPEGAEDPWLSVAAPIAEAQVRC